MDERAQQYTDSTQFSLDLGKDKIRAIGFYKYGDRIINISTKKMEEMAQWLEEHPEQDITNEFYGTGIESIIYKIEQLKEKCKQSKLPLNLINKAYEGIKNTMFGKKSVSEIQEESTRV